MNKHQQRLISEAKRKYKRIYPCTAKPSLAECFTLHNNKLLFWFNTDDHTTHVMTAEMQASYS
ncbi:MAG: hypothetical protein GF401_14905 [Chitinivibrionales bacterium]|nr:hypothetical protein [Chitinivibrionales bacterium]